MNVKQKKIPAEVLPGFFVGTNLCPLTQGTDIKTRNGLSYTRNFRGRTSIAERRGRPQRTTYACFTPAMCGGKAPPVRRSRAHGRLRAKQYGGDAFASPPVDRCHLRHLPLHWSLAFPYVGKSHWKKLYLKILSLGFCRVVFGSRHFFEVEPQNKFREISESEAASFWINAEAPHSSSSCDAFFKANHGSRLSRILRDKVQSNLRSCLCVLLHAACVSRLIIRASVCPHM